MRQRDLDREQSRELRAQFDALHVDWMQKSIAWAECKKWGEEQARKLQNGKLADLCSEWGRPQCH